MKTKDIRVKWINEIEKELFEKRKILQKLRFDLVTKNLKNHREIRKTKKEIAQILTILAEKKFIIEQGE